MRNYKVVTQDELDAREHKILQDGEVLRVPCTLMDHNSLASVLDRESPLGNFAPSHNARTVPLTDTEFQRRSAQIDAKNAALGDAWKEIPALPEDAKFAPTGDVYDRRDKRLEDAWRGAA